jgi:DNA-binding ferritin-like protein (Dps family)
MIKLSSLGKQLNESVEKLSLENRKIFDDIIAFIRASNLKTRDGEEFLQQMLDSFLNAQQQGTSIEIMLGTDDIRSYCKEIVDAYKSTYSILSRSGEYLMYFGITIVILSLFSSFGKNFIILMSKNFRFSDFSFYSYIDFDFGFITTFLIAVTLYIALMDWIKKNCFTELVKVNQEKNNFKVFVLIIFIWIMYTISNFVKGYVFFSLNIFIVVIIGTMSYLIGNYLIEKWE